MEYGLNSKGRLSPFVMAAGACLLLLGLAAAGYASEGAASAHHVDSAKQLKDFGWRVLDFSALVVILVWALKKADVKGSLANRRAGIERSLQEAVEAKKLAEKKFAEYNEKLAKANQEIDELQIAIKKEGELEKERIIAEAKAMAEKIREQANQAANQEILQAKLELRREAARLSVQLAEQNLKEKINKADQDRLVGEYLTKVVELH